MVASRVMLFVPNTSVFESVFAAPSLSLWLEFGGVSNGGWTRIVLSPGQGAMRPLTLHRGSSMLGDA